jgi:AcrR family transcriptional regulator
VFAETCDTPGPPEGLDARQRRLYEATISSTINLIATRGYEQLTVADIISDADVSRSFFYAHFEGVADAFGAAYQIVIGRLGERLFEAVEGEQAWPERIRAGLDAVAAVYAQRPQLVRLTMIEPAVVGPWAARRHQRCLERVFPLLNEGVAFVPRDHDLPDHLATMALGGAITLVVEGPHRDADLATLLGDVYYALLLPYMGPEEAALHSARAYPFRRN